MTSLLQLVNINNDDDKNTPLSSSNPSRESSGTASRVQIKPPNFIPDYRLKKIEIHRSDAIDQIKFTYSDDTTWVCGHNGGKEDPCVAVMTEEEYLTEVTHEKFYNYRSAGAAVSFTTNKGRTFGYYPNNLATRQKSEETTLKAKDGYEIISLKIRRGVIEGIVEQPVPKKEVKTHPSQWYAVASYKPKEDPDLDVNLDSPMTSSSIGGNGQIKYQHFCSYKEARNVFDAYPVTKKGQSYLLIDCLRREVVRSSGSTTTAINLVVQDGFCSAKSDDDVTLYDGLITLIKVLCNRADIINFLIVTALLIATSVLEIQSSLLAGKVLTMLGNNNEPSKLINDSWVAQSTCKHVLDCSTVATMAVYQKSLIFSYVFIKCIERLLYVANVYVHHNACDKKNRILRFDVFEHILHMDQSFFDTKSMSDIRGCMNVHTLNNLISWNIPYIIMKIVKMLLCIYFMAMINMRLGVLCTASIFMIKYGVLDPISVYEQKCHKIMRKLELMRDQVEGDALDMINSVKIFSKEEKHLVEHKNSSQRLIGSLHMIVILRCVREWGYGTLRVLTFGAVLYLGMNIIVESGMTAAELTSFFFIFQSVQELFHGFKWHYDVLIKELPDIDRFLTLMARKPQMKDGDESAQDIKGVIRFDNVKFEYPSRPGEQVLKGLNMTLKPNTVTAIVGDSGAGKTTIAKLLMRMYDPTSGEVTVDGVPLYKFRSKSLHNKIAIVPQNPDLFGTSIGENIAYGATETPTQAEIEAACKLANCHEFISKFRGGYDTFVGNRGAQLSGGQKQRIAIARAAIRNPQIMILDEATSALDAANEKLVQDALDSVAKNRTTLIIAHRLSTIKNADEIICMKDGVAVERGTHDNLMALNGVYHNLISKQTTE